jgi:hypothetical protein
MNAHAHSLSCFLALTPRILSAAMQCMQVDSMLAAEKVGAGDADELGRTAAHVAAAAGHCSMLRKLADEHAAPVHRRCVSIYSCMP